MSFWRFTSNNAKTSAGEKTEQKTTKQTELRQREQKLRKQEEELKIKEKMNSELQEERIWIKTYIHKLEIRINEPGQSNQMLRNQIRTCGQNVDKSKLNNIHSNDSSSIMDRIRDRVTTMILKQVDKQFNKVEGILNLMDNDKYQEVTKADMNLNIETSLNWGLRNMVNHRDAHVLTPCTDKTEVLQRKS